MVKRKLFRGKAAALVLIMALAATSISGCKSQTSTKNTVVTQRHRQILALMVLQTAIRQKQLLTRTLQTVIRMGATTIAVQLK